MGRGAYLERVDVLLARDDLHALQPADEVKLVLDLGRVALDLDGEERAREPRAEREHADALAADLRGLDAREQGCETTVEGGRVHVAAAACATHALLDRVLKVGLGEGHERLLEVLVGERSLVGLRKPRLTLGHVRVPRRIGVREEVVVHEAGMRLLHHLAVRRVEDGIVDVRERERGARAARRLLRLGVLVAERLVRRVDRGDIGRDRHRTVDLGVLRVELGLVEVVRVRHVRAVDRYEVIGQSSKLVRTRRYDIYGNRGTVERVARETFIAGTLGYRVEALSLALDLLRPKLGSHEEKRKVLTFDGERSVRPDEHRKGTSATSGTPTALRVDSDVTANDDRVPAVPGRGLDPVYSVEERGSRTIARVLGVDTLDVGVARLGEVVHQVRFGRLGLVDDRLGADIDATNGLGIDVVLFDEARHGWDTRAE